MIPVHHYEEFLKEIEEELTTLKITTPSNGIFDLLKKEAEDAIRAEFQHEHKNWSNDTYESQLKELRDRRESAVEKFQKCDEDHTLALKFLQDEIALKEKMRIATQAEIAKAQAVKV
jgi:hypothetical protein